MQNKTACNEKSNRTKIYYGLLFIKEGSYAEIVQSLQSFLIQ